MCLDDSIYEVHVIVSLWLMGVEYVDLDFLLNLVGLCLLQQLEYGRSDARSEKAMQSLPCSLEYSLLDSQATI